MKQNRYQITKTNTFITEIYQNKLQPNSQDQLMKLAKAVASATAGLVLNAKNVAKDPTVAQDKEKQNQVIAAATHCAMSTSQLVACTKVSINKIVNYMYIFSIHTVCFLPMKSKKMIPKLIINLKRC